MAAQRYREAIGPALLDPKLADTGDQGLAQQLEQASNTVTDIAVKWGGELRANQGADAGAAEGAAGTPNPREGLAELTKFGHAYNSAAEVAYSARTKTDIVSTIDRLKMENEGDPESFATKAQGAMEGTMNNVPEPYKPFLSLFVRGQVASGVTELANQAHVQNQHQAVADHLESMGATAKGVISAARSLPRAQGDALINSASENNKAELDALVKSHAMLPEVAVKLQEQFHQQLDAELTGERVGSAAKDILDNMKVSVTAGARKLTDFMANPNFSDEEKAAGHAMVEKGTNADAWDKSRTYSKQLNQVAVDIASGDYSQGLINRINNLADKNAFTPVETQGHLAAVERNSLEAEKKHLDLTQVTGAMQGLMPPGSPSDSEWVKKVTAHYDQARVEGGVQPLSERDVQLASLYMHKANVIPKSFEQNIQVAAMSGNAMQASIAANAYASVIDANPTAALFQEDPRMRPFLEQISSFTRNGIDPQTSYDMAKKNTFEITKDQKVVLEHLYAPKGVEKRVEANTRELQDFINSDPVFGENHLGGHWNSARPKPSPMDQAVYDGLRREAFLATNGNDEMSKKVALDGFKANYAVSTVNGYPEILKHAPEVRYPWLQPEVIRQDIDQTVKDVGWLLQSKDSKIEMAPNLRTDLTQGQEWSLVDTNGNRAVTFPNGQPVLYSLPVGPKNAERFQAMRDRYTEAAATKSQTEIASETAAREQAAASFGRQR